MSDDKITMVNELRPRVGIGPATLGMTESQLRAALGRPKLDVQLTESVQGIVREQFYSNHRLRISLNARDEVISVEALSAETVQVNFDRIDLFHRPIDDVIRDLARHESPDTTHPSSANTYVFLDLEMALWHEWRPAQARNRKKLFFDTVCVDGTGWYRADAMTRGSWPRR